MKDENGNTIVSPKTCKYCGEVFDASRTYSGINKTDDECFGCWFWRDWLEADKIDTKSVVVEGSHYHIGEEPTSMKNRERLAFGGSEFRILRDDGTITISHNLWHQGAIPAYWRQFFPDTAVFL